MEAAGEPSSKKRRLAAANPKPGAAEGSARRQEPPLPPGVDGDDDDRISGLPDELIGKIISLLPTRAGARTQVLESRWRHLFWRAAALNLDCRELPGGTDAHAAVVSRILSSHPGPGRRFCVDARRLRGDRAATVDAWLRSPALDNLEELEFVSDLPPPASTFRFSATLSVVAIGRCRLPDATLQGLHFPQIKHLALESVGISEISLHSLIVGCPVLESLLIVRGFGFRCVRINSLSLRTIGVIVYHMKDELQFEQLIIEDAPCLKRLINDDAYDLHVSIVSAPKLETVGFLSEGSNHCSTFVFGSTVIQGPRVDKLATVLRTIKILAVKMTTLSLDAVIELMICFPCLEKLYIQSLRTAPNNLWRRKHRNLIRCLDIRLKTIVLGLYRGTKSQVDFLTFFILNAKVLELMTLQVNFRDYNEEFLAEQRMKLQLEKRASSGAQLHSTIHNCVRNLWNIKDARDFDLTDPFAQPKN